MRQRRRHLVDSRSLALTTDSEKQCSTAIVSAIPNSDHGLSIRWNKKTRCPNSHKFQLLACLTAPDHRWLGRDIRQNINLQGFNDDRQPGALECIKRKGKAKPPASSVT